MPFHGNRGYCVGTKSFCIWIKSRPSKGFYHKNSPAMTTVKGIRSFLGHTSFYRRFIKDFSKISRPLCRLLEKDAKLDFDEACKVAFDEIKSILVIAPIMVTPDWNTKFKIMGDASDFAMGVVLGQRTKKMFKAIYYVNKIFNEEQENYFTTEKEMLAMVFASEKFRP